MNNEFKDVKAFLNNLKKATDNVENSKLVIESYVRIGSRYKILDALLLINNEPLAVFEFKKEIKSLLNQEIITLADELPIECRFIVFGDGNYFKVIDTVTSIIKHATNGVVLFQILFEKKNETIDRKTKLQIQDELIKACNTVKRDLNSLIKNDKTYISNERIEGINYAISLLSSDHFLEELDYNNNGQFFHFIDDLRNFDSLENKFFKSLVSDVPIGIKIFRYTSLDSVYRTIKENKIRLNGIVGMNDISEVGYVDSYLDKRFNPMGDDILVDSVNRKFIMCSSILEDELMQWRLYGDDCKGGCLVFKVTKNSELPGLLLRRISYGVEVNGLNFHPELELINRIKKKLKRILKIDFRFRTIDVWKHFFKSYEYAPEKEVRLLLIGNQYDEVKGEKYLTGVGKKIDVRWNLTTSHQILSPYILLETGDSRLKCQLDSIILGAKCPEIAINLKQFKHFATKRGLSHLECRPSKIKNYR
ncbi:MAG TPA: hypothetical protein DCE78_07795 [Bacteroidetes bacterium]|nr:hypothetical protein [Bacteroidota bacterium]